MTRPITPTRFSRPLLAVALVAAGCDGSYQGFLDAVPEPTSNASEPVRVFLGIDGMSRRAFDLARDRGAFAGWNVADLVTPFPGTSDYSWTRTLRAGAIGGYEAEYFDPTTNQLQGQGLAGVAEHPLHEGIFETYDCYKRFDFLGDGETWQARSYLDPVGSLDTTLDALFDTLGGRARTKTSLMAYLLTADVVSHTEGLDRAAWVLVEIGRRIRDFKAHQRRPFVFTLFADHGNAHLASELVEPRDVLRDVGVAPVDALAPGDDALEAVPIVHVRVSYVALHTRPARVSEIAARSSQSPFVDLAVAPEPTASDASASPTANANNNTTTTARFAIWRQGERFTFERDAEGTIIVAEPERWTWLGVDLAPFTLADRQTARLADREAFAATLPGAYPDIFYRVATAFSNPAARYPASLFWSMPDDAASVGFEIPFSGSIRANSGFHGSLTRAATMSVVASEAGGLPPALRSDDLADLFPILAGHAP
jgi:hypothetical protein